MASSSPCSWEKKKLKQQKKKKSIRQRDRKEKCFYVRTGAQEWSRTSDPPALHTSIMAKVLQAGWEGSQSVEAFSQNLEDVSLLSV